MNHPVAATPGSQQTAPIGVFDSGVGGLSVWREIVSQLPYENTHYLADQAHIPYGPRSRDEILRFSVAITTFLIQLRVKAIVIACNTASGASLQSLRAELPNIPFIGMEPAVKPAVERTRTGAVGVLATPTTFQGELFRRLVDRFGRNVRIHTQICPGLVEAVEQGDLDTPETRDLLSRCLVPMVAHNIDHLVLGCTHYPFLEPAIREIVGPSITVIDPGPAVARQVRHVVQAAGLLNSSTALPHHRFHTTGEPGPLSRMIPRLVNPAPKIEQLSWMGNEIRIDCRVHS